MWKLIHCADVFCLAENFSKLYLMPLVRMGILQAFPIPPPFYCFVPGPCHSWTASPWPLKVSEFASPDSKPSNMMLSLHP